jgi:ribonucleoside-diphosphate reductase beta chain
MTTARTEQLDILADGPGLGPSEHAGTLPSARALYFRWEQQQWSVARLDVTRDVPVWQGLRVFARQELLSMLTELEVGEVCVTHTLSSLVDHAPNEDDRLYLCTQLADEGRHVRFFQEYLTEAAGIPPEDISAGDSAYGRLFEPRLVASTTAVRASGGDRIAWCTALVEYHLVTEGVLAASALRTARQFARRFGLNALDEGLTNVARDESRHLTYGLSAARAAVDEGLGDAVADAYLSGVRLAARVLVDPDTLAVTPVMRAALNHRAAQLKAQWDLARDRAVRQLRLMGLPGLRDDLAVAWSGAFDSALAEYRERWDREHPVAAAGLSY